ACHQIARIVRLFVESDGIARCEALPAHDRKPVLLPHPQSYLLLLLRCGVVERHFPAIALAELSAGISQLAVVRDAADAASRVHLLAWPGDVHDQSHALN